MTAPEDTALTEQKRIMVDLHALHRRAYITPRRQERLRGAASRVSVPSPREPLPSSTVQRGAVNSSWNPLAVLAQAKAMQAAAGAERKSSIGLRKGWAAVGIGLARAKE